MNPVKQAMTAQTVRRQLTRAQLTNEDQLYWSRERTPAARTFRVYVPRHVNYKVAATCHEGGSAQMPCAGHSCRSGCLAPSQAAPGPWVRLFCTLGAAARTRTTSSAVSWRDGPRQAISHSSQPSPGSRSGYFLNIQTQFFFASHVCQANHELHKSGCQRWYLGLSARRSCPLSPP